jgi:sarcosine oxidase
MHSRQHVAVIGAGAFGGWTAWFLCQRGARVTLLDAWGPGNWRSSSGGETRVIRGAYGIASHYTRMTARALELWSEYDRKWNRHLLHRCGVLWMAESDDEFEHASLSALQQAGIPCEKLPQEELQRRWPQINFERVHWGIYEPGGGFLTANLACQAVMEQFCAAGGEYRHVAVKTTSLEECSDSLHLSDGTRFTADRFVFACGPWMKAMFPKTLGERIRVTKQEVFFFGTPAGDERFHASKHPVWADHRGRFLYGIPANHGRGFKIADDTRGPEFDPTNGQRTVSAENLELVREYLGFRFPALKNAPLLDSYVCQYENSSDHDFIIDRHPANDRLWLVGGGSGHGFKHGPAVGELVAKLVLGDGAAEERYRLARFAP